MKNKFNIILLIVIISAIFWRVFIPGVKVANDFPLISHGYLNSLFDLPRVWTDRGGEGLGEYAIFSQWSYPASLLMGFMAHTGFSFEVIEKLIYFTAYIILGSFSIWRLLTFYKISTPAKFFGAILYLTNSYIVLIIDGGQLLISLAYAWFPLAYLLVIKAKDSSLKSKIIAGIAVTLLGFFDVRFIFVLFILCLVNFIYELIENDFKNFAACIKKWVLTGIVVGIIFTGLNAFWLITIILSPVDKTFFAQLIQTSFTSFATLGHTIFLISPNWYRNVFGEVSSLKIEFILIPIIVFLAPILQPRKYAIGLWLVVALLGIFLAKGSNQPFPDVYQWLYYHVSGFSLFRDSTKFFFLITLSYAVLGSFTIDAIIEKFSKRKIILYFLSVAPIFYLLFIIKPIIFGGMTGTFSTPWDEKGYKEIENILKNDNNFSRSFWIPATMPLTYSDTKHPLTEASRLVEQRPFAEGVKGTYEVFNYLREAPFMGQLFDVSGIGYVIYPSFDFRRESPSSDALKYYQTFLNQLSNLPWLSKIENTKIPIFKTKAHQDKFFITNNTWVVIGSDSLYSESTKSAKLALSNNALVFLEEGKTNNYPNNLNDSKIVLNNKSLVDLAASFIDKSNLIFPAKNLALSPDKTGWWKRDGKDTINWRNFLNTKYGIDNQDFDLGGGWAIGEGNLTLPIKIKDIKPNIILLARVMESSQSGIINFNQGNDLIGSINTSVKTKVNETNFKWSEVGKLISENNLEIKTVGNINILNSLAFISENEWNILKQKAEKLEHEGKVVDFAEPNVISEHTNVVYKEVSPTEYKVTVSGLKHPATLVFSQSYDKYWKLGDQEPFPVYSILNGFTINKDGEYVIKYQPQRYINLSLTISVLFSLLLVAYFIWSINSKD